MARIAFVLLALFAEMERTFGAERAAHAVAGGDRSRRAGPAVQPVQMTCSTSRACLRSDTT
jgi:hypothetical protein